MTKTIWLVPWQGLTSPSNLRTKSFLHVLKPRIDELGDLVLLPPDSINFEGLFLDNQLGSSTPTELSGALGGVPVEVFGGDWVEMIERLAATA